MRKKKENDTDERVEPNSNTEETVLDVSASMQGTLRFDDPVNLRINGKFEGTLDIKGKLMIGHKADINANITGEHIAVAGKVQGNIVSTKGLTLEPTAVVTGDIDTAGLVIHEGAVFNGSIHMTKNTLDVNVSRGDWMTANQLAKYLEVADNKITEWANTGVLPATKEAGEWVFEKAKVDSWIANGKVKA